MEPTEKRAAAKAAAIFRVIRRRLGMGQVTLANQLGVSQGYLSKMEAGCFVPSISLWSKITDLGGVPVGCFTTGRLERFEKAEIRCDALEGGFRLPESYRRNRGSKVRAVLPFLNFFRRQMGSESLRQYLKAKKVPQDFFVDLDLQINMGFSLDMVSTLIEKGHLNMATVSDLVKATPPKEKHGSLHLLYETSPNLQDLVSRVMRQSLFYECNFQYQVEEAGSRHIDFSILEQEHVSESHFMEDIVLGGFYEVFRLEYFKDLFSSYLDGQEVGVTLLSSKRENNRGRTILRASIH